ncbi:hypothetical protein EMCRGX_G025441 [Ephydatia muelleri]|eukprot:Em0021g270a
MAGLTLQADQLLHCASFSPHSRTCHLLAIGGTSKLVVKSCILVESELQQSSLLDALEFADVAQVDTGFTTQAISWSAATTHEQDSYRLVLCVLSGDRKIWTLSIDPHNTEQKVLEGCVGTVNSLACHPTTEGLMASTGDDQTCQVWDLGTGQVGTTFRLTSSGVAVCWSPFEATQLMVAEKNGRIRFYDLCTNTPVMSLATSVPPLIDAHWSPSNSLMVGCVASGRWYLWDTSKSSLPSESKFAHTNPVTKFRWCPHTEQAFATLSCSGEVKVHDTRHHRTPLTYNTKVSYDVCWHPKLPLLIIPGDHCVHVWQVTI